MGLAVFAGACNPGAQDGPAAGAADAGLFVELFDAPAGPGSSAPFLASGADGIWMSWLEPGEEGVHRLLVSRLGNEGVGRVDQGTDGEWADLDRSADSAEGGLDRGADAARVGPEGRANGAREDPRWGEVVEAGRSDLFFVNWADFPIIAEDGAGRLWTHWLERGGSGAYDYAVRLVNSPDGGRSWSRPVTLHDDDSPTEHGFVSSVVLGRDSEDRAGEESRRASPPMAFAWLDGREMAPSAGGAPEDPEMTLRYREVGVDGAGELVLESEVVLDARTCECCQTDMVVAPGGPVVVYRNRSPDELRDIYVTRREGGTWSEPKAVHDDGWRFEGCPVNGPAAAVSGSRLAVVWFTAAENRPSVRVAISEDFGASFGPPVLLDGGNPLGRVELASMGDGSFLAIWLERTPEGGADLVARAIEEDGRLGRAITVGETGALRASGFPRAAADVEGSVLVAWTDSDGDGRVRVARIARSMTLPAAGP